MLLKIATACRVVLPAQQNIVISLRQFYHHRDRYYKCFFIQSTLLHYLSLAEINSSERISILDVIKLVDDSLFLSLQFDKGCFLSKQRIIAQYQNNKRDFLCDQPVCRLWRSSINHQYLWYGLYKVLWVSKNERTVTLTGSDFIVWSPPLLSRTSPCHRCKTSANWPPIAWCSRVTCATCVAGCTRAVTHSLCKTLLMSRCESPRSWTWLKKSKRHLVVVFIIAVVARLHVTCFEDPAGSRDPVIPVSAT